MKLMFFLSIQSISWSCCLSCPPRQFHAYPVNLVQLSLMPTHSISWSCWLSCLPSQSHGVAFMPSKPMSRSCLFYCLPKQSRGVAVFLTYLINCILIELLLCVCSLIYTVEFVPRFSLKAFWCFLLVTVSAHCVSVMNSVHCNIHLSD